MATDTSPTRLAPSIRSMLASLRLRILGYVFCEGVALAIAWLGLAFWLSLGFDWSIEPPVLVRQIVLGVAAAGLVYVVFRYILRRLWAPLADRNLALLLERRFGKFGDSLLTTVELSEQPGHAEPFNRELLAQTQAAAVERLSGVQLGNVFRRGPLLRGATAALAAVLSVSAMAVFAPEAWGVWTERNLKFSDILWPRRTHLVLDGFGPDKRIKVAKGSDVTVVVKADTSKIVPESVQIRYRTDEGRGRENMSRVGNAAASEKFQPFSLVFHGILSSRTFDVVGGDDALRDYKIDVVDVPAIDMVLHCEYPAYTGRQPRDLQVAGQMQLPQGTKLTVHATANKELVEVPIQRVIGEKTSQLDTIRPPEGDRREFTYSAPRLDQDQTLLFTLVDTDGIRSREPVRLILTATPDEPPRVGLHLRGIGTAITPQARLPLEGDVSDDYGVAKLWFEYKVDQADPVRVPLRTAPRGRTELHFDRVTDEALDMKERKLAIGQQVSIGVVAEDNCTLAGGPNVGLGEKFQLSVVSPDQLLSILEARELTWRMRLEVIVQEVSDARNRLAQLDLAPPAKKPPAAAKAPPSVKATPDAKSPPPKATDVKATDAKATDAKAAAAKPVHKLAPGAEPGDASAKSAGAGGEPGDEGDEGVTVHRLPPEEVVNQTLGNIASNVSDIVTVAQGFDDIREELVNNRIDTPALEYRLKDQIAVPLRRVAEEMFPELELRLKKLQTVLADPAASQLQRDAAVRQYDAILVEMHQVLNKMLELESFNEVVERLRELIDAQAKLNHDTQQRQKQEALRGED